MSTATVDASSGRSASGNSGALRRLRALGRAELTLLYRNKSAMFVALVLPVLMTFAMRESASSMPLSGTGLSVGTVLVPGAIGYVLLFAVYGNLLGVYVSRREELVLKRLRTGEARDVEILAGASLPAVALGVAQCAVLLAGGAALLHLPPPERPELVAAGVVLGTVMMVAAAAASAAFTRTTESAQITAFPLMVISLIGSGVVVPLDVMPDRVADVCSWLPLSPVMRLVRDGWIGELGGVESLKALALTVLWTALTVFAVRRWFRWEPRR
jgi:ABC-2 type transport system permease protein